MLLYIYYIYTYTRVTNKWLKAGISDMSTKYTNRLLKLRAWWWWFVPQKSGLPNKIPSSRTIGPTSPTTPVVSVQRWSSNIACWFRVWPTKLTFIAWSVLPAFQILWTSEADYCLANEFYLSTTFVRIIQTLSSLTRGQTI